MSQCYIFITYSHGIQFKGALYNTSAHNHQPFHHQNLFALLSPATMAADREPIPNDFHDDTMTDVRDSVDVHSIKRDLTDMKKELQVDSLGRAQQSFERPRNLNGLILPCAAYRLVIDFLRCDPSFCNNAIPDFLPFGWVCLSFRTPQQVRIQGKDVKNSNADEVRISLRRD